MPYHEVVIHEILEQDNDVLFDDVVRQAMASQAQVEPTVNWIDGIAFLAIPLPPTEDIVKENLAGRIHFASVIFTRIQFQARVPVQIGSQSYSVRLRKNEKNKILLDMVQFLKDFKPSLVGSS